MYNKSLAIRFLLRWKSFGWRADGYKKIRSLGYTKYESISFTDFVPFPQEPKYNWNVIRGDMDSGFCNKNCHLTPNSCCVFTSADRVWGFNDNTPPAWETRPTRTGLLDSEPMELNGLYSVEMYLDPKAKGDWAAWWFFMISGEGYYEIDMMENFPGDDPSVLTTSIHSTGSGHNMWYRVKKNRTIHQMIEFCDGRIKVYVNGTLVWVDWLFPVVDGEIIMKINCGLGKKAYYGKTKYDLSKEPYVFNLSNLKHYTK